MCFYVLLSSCKKTPKTVILFKYTEHTFYLICDKYVLYPAVAKVYRLVKLCAGHADSAVFNLLMCNFRTLVRLVVRTELQALFLLYSFLLQVPSS